MPAHSDRESDIKPKSTIAAVSIFGSTTLQIFAKINEPPIHEIYLPAGSMYTMELDFQNLLYHGTKPSPLSRGSITFRDIFDDRSKHLAYLRTNIVRPMKRVPESRDSGNSR